MAKKIIVLWRDIPSQVIVKQGRRKGRAQLSQRFQAAIDRAAMRAGKGASDAYIEEWRRVTTDCGKPADIHALAEREAERIESEYTEERLTQLIRSHGQEQS